nr:zinc finger, CCHC-type [Tanacetum cinerariifolium]
MNGGNEEVSDIEERRGKRDVGYELPIECNHIIQERNPNNRDKPTTKSYHRMLDMLERERHDQLERKKDDRWVVVEFIHCNEAGGTESTPRVSNSGLKDIHQSGGFSAIGSNSLLSKVITRFQVISGNYLCMSVVYVLTTPMPESGGDNPALKQVKKRAKWDNDDYVCRGLILNDFKHTLKHLKEELTLVELRSHLRIEKSLRAQDNDKPKGNNVAGPSVVNMVYHNNSPRYNDNKGKRKHHDNKADPNKKPKVTCWKCGKPEHLKKD